MTGESLIRATLTSFLEKLKLDAWFTEHGVRLLMENQMDLLGQIDEVLASSTGLALIVKAPEAENNRSAFTLTLELLALENPILNRARPEAVTALEAIWHAALALDGADAMLRRIEHTEDPEGGLFQARATFTTLIAR